MPIVEDATQGRKSRRVSQTEEPETKQPQTPDEGQNQAPDNLPATTTPEDILADQDIGVPAQSVVAKRRKVEFDRDSGMSGDWDVTDFPIDSLRVVRGSGEASKLYSEGTILIGEDTVLLDAPNLNKPDASAALRVIPFSQVKRYKEHISKDERDAGVVPNFADTEDEVIHERGGSLHKGTAEAQGLRWYVPIADLYMLVERPEGCDSPLFSIELDGKQYAEACYYVRSWTDFLGFRAQISKSVRSVLSVTETDPETGEVVMDEAGFPKRKPCLYKCFWEFRAGKERSKDYMVWTPKVRMREQIGPQAFAYIRYLLGV